MHNITQQTLFKSSKFKTWKVLIPKGMLILKCWWNHWCKISLSWNKKTNKNHCTDTLYNLKSSQVIKFICLVILQTLKAFNCTKYINLIKYFKSAQNSQNWPARDNIELDHYSLKLDFILYIFVCKVMAMWKFSLYQLKIYFQGVSSQPWLRTPSGSTVWGSAPMLSGPGWC